MEGDVTLTLWMPLPHGIDLTINWELVYEPGEHKH